jgi:UDP-N-acetylglucosamine 3-dehydrogenase
MNNSKPIRWGVIGLGWFGEVHADNLAEMPDIELTALCTRRPERLAEIADRLGVEKRYTDYHQLLADPDVDSVSVTTHFYDHRQITIDALRAGKHVLLEKPMAPTVADCDQILKAAEEARGLFMVGHICRFDPRVALAKEAIEQGRIGKIISMHARRNLSKAIGGLVLDDISALMGDGIHDADLMLWFSQANVRPCMLRKFIPDRTSIRMEAGRSRGWTTVPWPWSNQSGTCRRARRMRSMLGWKSSVRKELCISTAEKPVWKSTMRRA